MDKYVGQELKDSIESLQVKSAMSKEGHPYTYISLRLGNGYEKRLFIQSAEEFAFLNAFELLSSSRAVDRDY